MNQKQTYTASVYVPLATMTEVTAYLDADKPGQYQGTGNTITMTAKFPDGMQMDIKCCGCDDQESWTEAVLFNSKGSELCCTEPCDDFIGEWEIEYNGITYKAFLILDPTA